jgi:hypothetical protein
MTFFSFPTLVFGQRLLNEIIRRHEFRDEFRRKQLFLRIPLA